MKRIIPILLLVSAALFSCGRSQQSDVPDSAFAEYIKAYTGGIIGEHSTIRVELTSDIPDEKRTEEKLFSFSPSVKGSVRWNSPSSVEFIPDDGALKPGTSYDIKFRLGEIMEIADKKLKVFPFGIVVRAAKEADGEIETFEGEGFHVVSALLQGDHVDLKFSAELGDNASAKGLITLSGVSRSHIKVEGDIARVYFSDRKEDMVLTVDTAVKDADGNPLSAVFRKTFYKNQIKPAVGIPVSGNILPDKANLVLPLRAVNLSAVDITVIRIYEKNILSFLQANDIAGSEQLRRSGRLVYSGTVSLAGDPSKDLHAWNDFGIDLSGLFAKEPGAIYRIRASFKKEYSLYNKDLSDISVPLTGDGVPSAAEMSSWDEPVPYYWESFYDWSEYDYDEEDNPDHASYYMLAERFPVINLMTSEIGMLAKGSADGSFFFTVTDLRSAKPISGASVEVYDYQLQLIASGKTGGDGCISLKPSHKAFVALARNGKSTTYLKITDGDQLSMSRFDVGGKIVKDGIKAFIYGERGVWRPGDTLHVTAVIMDSGHSIPDGHPASLELYTPEGQFYTRKVSTGSDGFYCFNIPTKDTDPTGFWNAWVKIGGSSFSKSLSIETIKPNRLKINTTFPQSVLRAKSRISLDVDANWLTGPAASGLEAKAVMTLRQAKTAFKGFDNYIFDPPGTYYSSSEHQLFRTRLDGNGHASVDVTLPPAYGASGMLNAFVVSSVMESGGDESFTTESFTFSPFTHYVGLRIPESESSYLETDKDLVFSLVCVDENGRRTGGHRIEYGILKMNWSWWWECGSSIDSYIDGYSAESLLSGSVVSSASKDATFSFKLDYPAWGSFVVYARDTQSGHITGTTVYIDWPEWRGRASRRDPEMLTMLTFSTDKESYKAGESATVYIPAAPGGQALITVENSAGVLSSKWVSTSKDADTAVKIPVTAAMAPNFYIYITLLQPYGNASNDLPIRMYGVKRIGVTNPDSHLEPVIKMPDKLHPEEEFTVKVSEKNGKAMTYTLAIVDEGLLDITGFKTPNPWNKMYETEALGVRTWDMYDAVVGALSGRFSATAAIGGDQDEMVSSRKDNRFNPIVKFIGPVSIGKGGSESHKIRLPMYVGSVRVMVVAGHEESFGCAEKAVPVKSPLMILSTLPRVMSISETVALPVNVFALEDNVKDVKVNVSVDGPVSIEGPSSQSLKFAKEGDQLASFMLKANGEGPATVKITASSGLQKANEEIHIDVRHPNPIKTSVYFNQIAKGKSVSLDAEEDGLLTLASFPVVNASAIAQKVFDYPYDCTEQLASRGLALLHLMPLLENEEAAKAKDLIPHIINSIYARQKADGGFSYWSSSSYSDTWVSSLAGLFLSDASAKGYKVSAGVLSAWKKYQKKIVTAYRHAGNSVFSDVDQSFRLYTLAAAGAAETGAMNRLSEASDLKVRAKWQLASAYALSGNVKTAASLVEKVDQSFEEYDPYNITYGSTLRDKCLALEAYALTNNMSTAYPVALDIAESAGKGYMSTSEMAFAAIALDRLHEKFKTDAIDAVLTVDGKSKNITSAKATVTNKVKGNIKVENKSDGTLFATLVVQSRPAPGTFVPATSNGLKVDVSYTDLEGKPIAVEQLPQGIELFVNITARNTSGIMDRRNIALTNMLPAGWEVVNERLTTGADSYGNMDIRDDRVVWYFDLARNRSKSFKVKVRTAYEGDYILPAVTLEAMYEPGIAASTASSRVSVVK
ncbi:MAG: alpha-2-macroglobulin [Bacteroidales bacterium]|nr:alpha-2-macroglobulin [Bacteroidales bacterium]